MKLTELAVDAGRGEQGAWVDEIPEMEGLRLKVRSDRNADWRRLQMKLMEAIPRKKRMGGRIDPDEMDKILSRCMLNTCLLDWDGLEGDDGKPIPYSRDMAEKLLFEPEYRRFRDSVAFAASIVAEKTDERRDDAAGNLLTLSGGSTTGGRKSNTG